MVDFIRAVVDGEAKGQQCQQQIKGRKDRISGVAGANEFQPAHLVAGRYHVFLAPAAAPLMESLPRQVHPEGCSAPSKCGKPLLRFGHCRQRQAATQRRWAVYCRSPMSLEKLPKPQRAPHRQNAWKESSTTLGPLQGHAAFTCVIHLRAGGRPRVPRSPGCPLAVRPQDGVHQERPLIGSMEPSFGVRSTVSHLRIVEPRLCPPRLLRRGIQRRIANSKLPTGRRADTRPAPARNVPARYPG